MKHCIIVKFREGYDFEGELPAIAAIFEQTRAIAGARETAFIKGINRRGNRYDLMIEMDMDAESLPAYDASAAHREWKERYGEHIEKKAIFDYE